LNKGVKRNQLKVRIVYIPVPFNRLLPALMEGQGDIAAAVLTITPERERRVAFATGGRRKVDEIVVAGEAVEGLSTVEDLSGRTVYVLRASSYVEHLHQVNAQLHAKGKAPIKIKKADSNLLTEDILELVNSGVINLTVADDYKARLWANVLPNLVVREDLKVHSRGTVGWAVRQGNPELLKSLNRFTQQIKKGTLLGNMIFKRYYENTHWIRNPLEQKERQKLNKFRVLFKKYADQYGFDNLAIAAQAYQESGLNHSVRSPRGATGIMQLLPSTAADPMVGIADIENVANNIHAGVKYLALLRDSYFSDPTINDDDRLAFSWAAYNAGPRKVAKMQQRATKMGLDPNKWFQNVEYAALKMVGQETVQYVANIYKYYIAYKLIKDIEDRKAAKIKSKM
jgi:membrane-bound lytic murein transglycosylase MltF